MIDWLNLGPKILGALPKKCWGPKTCKIWVTSDNFKLRSRISSERISIRSEDIRDRSLKLSEVNTVSKIGKKHVTDSDSSRVRRKKSGELWSTNNAVLQALSDPPKSTFSEDHISAPRGRCLFTFLQVLEIDQAHTPPGAGVPQQFLTMNIQKLA